MTEWTRETNDRGVAELHKMANLLQIVKFPSWTEAIVFILILLQGLSIGELYSVVVN